MSLKQKFIKYVSLNILGMIGLSCYILADTVFVANGAGADGLTALNLAIPVYSVINGIGLMIGMGGATRFSISKSKSALVQSLYFMIIAASLFFLAGIFLPDEIARLMGSDSATHEMTRDYLRVILLFSPMFILNNVIICAVRNDGNPKLSMAAMLSGSFSNIILDYIFIFPLKMGVFGAALATGIAPLVSLSVLSAHFFRKENTLRLCREAPKLSAVRDIASLGVSSLIAELSAGIAIVIFNTLLLGLEGNTGVAAYGIIANTALVAISVFTGIAQGIQPILSDSFGSGKHDDVRKTLKYGFVTALFIAAVIYAVCYIFTDPIVAAFNRDNSIQLAEMAGEGLRIYFTAFGFMGINILSAAYFSAVGKPANGFIISVSRALVVLAPVALLLAKVMGLTGVWLALTVTEGIVTAVCFIMLRKSASAK